jgi:phage shock protein C
MSDKRLYRSRTNRIIGGVAGGLGEYFDIDPLLIRILFVILAFPSGLGIIAYLIGWVAIPEHPDAPDKKHGHEEIKDKVEQVASDVKGAIERSKDPQDANRVTGGVILLVLGIVFLLNNLFGYHLWAQFWPVVLILLGLSIIFRSNRR